MELTNDFAFRPLPPIGGAEAHHAGPVDTDLGALAGLKGSWHGTGFNVIWRPFSQPGQDRFLELNLTEEKITFERIPGAIPNRGLLQPDITMFGLTYLQQISDPVENAGLHIEPGIWATVPPTSDPLEPTTVVRMASIPHGTTILAQGTSLEVAGPPRISPTNILPFVIGSPTQTITFPEQGLGTPSPFRQPEPPIPAITQQMVDDPNSVLVTAIDGQTITHTTVLVISTEPSPVLGGGTSNTAFLAGAAPAGANANAVEVTAIFWIETVQGEHGHHFQQLQYTQRVLLNFNGLSWPHITVATLRKR